MRIEQSIEPRKYYPALDGLRGIAALMVFGFHFIQASPRGGWASRFNFIATLGQSGVDLFFVLSGFLITGILLDSERCGQSIWNFIARRSLRIFPLYYFALIIYLLVLPLFGYARGPDLISVLSYVFYGQNITPTFHYKLIGPGHFWSLAVEEHFYLLWPLVVLRAKMKYLIGISASMLIVSFLSRIVFVLAGYETFYFTLCRFDGLTCGAILAVWHRTPGSTVGIRAIAKNLLIGIAVICAPAYLVFSGSGSEWLQILKPTCWAALYFAIVAWIVCDTSKGPVIAILSSKILRNLGRHSYAIYVFQPIAIHWSIGQFPNSSTAALASALVGSYCISILVWIAIERPFLALKDKLPNREHVAFDQSGAGVVDGSPDCLGYHANLQAK